MLVTSRVYLRNRLSYLKKITTGVMLQKFKMIPQNRYGQVVIFWRLSTHISVLTRLNSNFSTFKFSAIPVFPRLKH